MERRGLQMCLEQREGNVLQDRISEMPDDILSYMLSLLPLREATRTSILSPRWRFLWKNSVAFSSSLTLDALAMRGSNYCEDPCLTLEDLALRGSRDYSNSKDMLVVYKEGIGYRTNRQLLSIERLKFVQWVDQILHLAWRIGSFRLQFFFRKDFAHHLDQWINIAISKRVQNFHINLSHFHISGLRLPNEKFYTFPNWLFTQETGSLVKRLCLKSCILGGSLNFSSLLDLHLEFVLIDDQDSFISFLSNSSNLEKLSLVKCKQLHSLKIFGPFLKLKHLALINCFSSSYVEISAKYLTSLEYRGDPVDFSFVDVPRLSHVIINIFTLDLFTVNYLSPNLSSHLTKLESLLLSVIPIESAIVPGMFANLKKLMLMVTAIEGTIWEYIPLLHASPNLDTLEIHWSLRTVLNGEEEEGLVQIPLDSPHRCLKHITVTGFNGSRHDVEFTTYLLNNVTSLKDITIRYDSTQYNYEEGFYNVRVRRSKNAEIAEKQRRMEEQGTQQLMNIVPPGVELLFV